ncbi:MAG: hypothetical protein WA624_20295 [Methylocella sp.]
MNNEKRATQLVGKLIGLIHGHPRTAMKALTAEDGKDFLNDVDKIVAEEDRRKGIDARAAAHITGDDDLTLAKRFNPAADSGEIMRKVHEHGRPMLGNRPAASSDRLGGVIPRGQLSKGMIDEMNRRFDRDRRD